MLKIMKTITASSGNRRARPVNEEEAAGREETILAAQKEPARPCRTELWQRVHAAIVREQWLDQWSSFPPLIQASWRAILCSLRLHEMEAVWRRVQLARGVEEWFCCCCWFLLCCWCCFVVCFVFAAFCWGVRCVGLWITELGLLGFMWLEVLVNVIRRAYFSCNK